MGRRIVVVGGTLWGPTAAARARETDESASITIVQRGSRLNFAFAGLAHHLSGEVAELSHLDEQGALYFKDVYGIDVLLHSNATELDREHRTVTVATSDGAIEHVRQLPYDDLVFALGAERMPLPGVAGDNVFRLRSFKEIMALRLLLADRPPSSPAHVVVVGAGAGGLEAVDGLVRAGARVTLLERAPHLLPHFTPTTTAPLVAHLQDHHVRVRVGVDVVGAELDTDGQRVQALHLHDGSRVRCDVVVVCVGVRPETALLARAGVALRDDGTVAVDERAEVAPNIYACGSSVAVANAVTGAPMWWAQSAIADKVAQVAGENAAGGRARTWPFAGSMMLRVLELDVGRAGLSQEEAVAAYGEADIDVTPVTGHSHEVWWPGSRPLTAVLVSQRSTGRVVGAEAVGAVGVDKRVDVAATAVVAGLTVEQLASLDLGDAGAFNAARDVWNIAANLATVERHHRGSSITPTEFMARRDLLVVDVRDHVGPSTMPPPLPGAIVMPLSSLRRDLERLDRTCPTVVYSGNGRRGFLAMQLLRQRGFFEVHNLAGGLQALRAEQAAAPR
jgi:NADPH-dependent 2,4-dienoyl-CoA reductase/sulfur reductase-like enzyme/rhodanese-related sulfurtransferase